MIKTLEELETKFEHCVNEYVECEKEDKKLDEIVKTSENKKQIRELEGCIREKQDNIWKQIEKIFEDMIAIESIHILKLLQKYYGKQDFDTLDILIEYMRMSWYPSQNESASSSLKLILEIALDLLESQKLTSNSKIMWFVKQVYDIIFHQYGMGGEPTENTNLFLELSLKILEPKYYSLRENEVTEYSYTSCIYFMGMLDIIDRPEDFLALWEKMQASPIHYLVQYQREWWEESFVLVSTKNK